MPDKPIIFKTLSNIEEAETIVAQLAQHHIAYEIESPPELLDRNFIGEQPMPDHFIKIRPADFTKANEVVEALYKSMASDVDEEYYLFQFSTEQLQEVVHKRSEWGDLNYYLALQILKTKDLTNTNEQFSVDIETNFLNIVQPVPVSFWILAAGYFCLLIPPFLYGYPAVGSLFIGWFIVGANKTLSNGTTHHTYDKKSRLHGKVIITLSILIIAYLLLIIYDSSYAIWFFDWFPF